MSIVLFVLGVVCGNAVFPFNYSRVLNETPVAQLSTPVPSQDVMVFNTQINELNESINLLNQRVSLAAGEINELRSNYVPQVVRDMINESHGNVSRTVDSYQNTLAQVIHQNNVQCQETLSQLMNQDQQFDVQLNEVRGSFGQTFATLASQIEELQHKTAEVQHQQAGQVAQKSRK
jgi:hypothetical protein